MWGCGLQCVCGGVGGDCGVVNCSVGVGEVCLFSSGAVHVW